MIARPDTPVSGNSHSRHDEVYLGNMHYSSGHTSLPNDTLSEGELSLSTEDDVEHEHPSLDHSKFTDYSLHDADLRRNLSSASDKRAPGFANYYHSMNTTDNAKFEYLTPHTDYSSSFGTPLYSSTRKSDDRPRSRSYRFEVVGPQDHSTRSDDARSYSIGYNSPESTEDKQNYSVSFVPDSSGVYQLGGVTSGRQNNGSVIQLMQESIRSKAFQSGSVPVNSASPEEIIYLKSWYQENHHKISLLNFIVQALKDLLSEHLSDFNSEESCTPEMLINNLQNCMKSYKRTVTHLSQELNEANRQKELLQRLNSQNVNVASGHEERFASGVEDPMRQVLVAVERAKNARQQAADLQTQLSLAQARISELEGKKREGAQEAFVRNLVAEKNSLQNTIMELKDCLIRYGEKIKYLESLSPDSKYESQYDMMKNFVDQLEHELSLQRSLVEMLKGEMQEKCQQNKELLKEMKREEKMIAVLQARVKSAHAELAHKDRQLGMLREEILHHLTQASARQKQPSVQWFTAMKQAIEIKDKEIEDISEALAEREIKLSNLNCHMKSRDLAIIDLNYEIQLSEELIVLKNKELAVKRQQIKSLICDLKRLEGDIFLLQQKVTRKEKSLSMLKAEINGHGVTVAKSDYGTESEKFSQISEMRPTKNSVVQEIQESLDKGLLDYVNQQWSSPQYETQKSPFKMVPDKKTAESTGKENTESEEPTESHSYLPHPSYSKSYPKRSEAEKGLVSPLFSSQQSKSDKPKQLSVLKVTDDTRKQSLKHSQNPEGGSFRDTGQSPRSFNTEPAFSECEMDSKIQLRSPDNFAPIQYSQNTNINSVFPNEETDADEMFSQLEVRHITDLKVGSPTSKNRECNSGELRQRKTRQYKPIKAQKNCMCKEYQVDKCKFFNPWYCKTHRYVDHNDVGNDDTEKWQKTIVLKSPSDKNNPVVVNINVKPQPLISTESGDRFVCDLGMNVCALPNKSETEDVTQKRNSNRNNVNDSHYAEKSFKVTETPEMGTEKLKSSGTYLILNKDNWTPSQQTTHKLTSQPPSNQKHCDDNETINQLPASGYETSNKSGNLFLKSLGKEESLNTVGNNFLKQHPEHTERRNESHSVMMSNKSFLRYLEPRMETTDSSQNSEMAGPPSLFKSTDPSSSMQSSPDSSKFGAKQHMLKESQQERAFTVGSYPQRERPEIKNYSVPAANESFSRHRYLPAECKEQEISSSKTSELSPRKEHSVSSNTNISGVHYLQPNSNEIYNSGGRTLFYNQNAASDRPPTRTGMQNDYNGNRSPIYPFPVETENYGQSYSMHQPYSGTQ